MLFIAPAEIDVLSLDSRLFLRVIVYDEMLTPFHDADIDMEAFAASVN